MYLLVHVWCIALVTNDYVEDTVFSIVEEPEEELTSLQINSLQDAIGFTEIPSNYFYSSEISIIKKNNNYKSYFTFQWLIYQRETPPPNFLV
ncbi:MAG: hypothetical protein ACOVQE_03415 [Chitinophagaceae bacterium]